MRRYVRSGVTLTAFRAKFGRKLNPVTEIRRSFLMNRDLGIGVRDQLLSPAPTGWCPVAVRSPDTGFRSVASRERRDQACRDVQISWAA